MRSFFHRLTETEERKQEVQEAGTRAENLMREKICDHRGRLVVDLSSCTGLRPVFHFSLKLQN